MRARIYDKQNVEKKTYCGSVGGGYLSDGSPDMYADAHLDHRYRKCTYYRGGNILRAFGGMCGGGDSLYPPRNRVFQSI